MAYSLDHIYKKGEEDMKVSKARLKKKKVG